ncbi:MAG TPA: carbohydrate porin [Alphaproteobacteria bacterium]|nr:carbohydrate porin [Alphaproteobacteria bacterium]
MARKGIVGIIPTEVKTWLLERRAMLLASVMALALITADPARAGCLEHPEDCSGLTFDAVYTGEIWGNLSGGIQTNHEYIDNLDMTMEVDMDKVANIPGGTLFLYGLANSGSDFTGTTVGDSQTISNIDAERALRLYEAWYEQNLFGDILSVKLGLMDLNAEFDVLETASLFINGAHGIGLAFSQAGNLGPSIFPYTAAGARVRLNFTDALSWSTVVFDGVPGDPDHTHRTRIKFADGDGALVTTEMDYEPGDGTKFGAGFWHFTEPFDDLVSGSAVKHQDNSGFYLLGEFIPFREDPDLTLFARYGIANEDINQYEHYIGAGATYTGPFEGRDEDQLGFAIGIALNGDPYKTANSVTTDEEVNFELTYHAQVLPWLALQPDFQYVVNPGAGANGDLDNAVVLGMRFEITPFQ